MHRYTTMIKHNIIIIVFTWPWRDEHAVPQTFYEFCRLYGVARREIGWIHKGYLLRRSRSSRCFSSFFFVNFHDILLPSLPINRLFYFFFFLWCSAFSLSVTSFAFKLQNTYTSYYSNLRW